MKHLRPNPDVAPHLQSSPYEQSVDWGNNINFIFIATWSQTRRKVRVAANIFLSGFVLGHDSLARQARFVNFWLFFCLGNHWINPWNWLQSHWKSIGNWWVSSHGPSEWIFHEILWKPPFLALNVVTSPFLMLQNPWVTSWDPPVISWLTTPIYYNYILSKPNS